MGVGFWLAAGAAFAPMATCHSTERQRLVSASRAAAFISAIFLSDISQCTEGPEEAAGGDPGSLSGTAVTPAEAPILVNSLGGRMLKEAAQASSCLP